MSLGLSPIKGDINKKKGYGQEIRIAFIDKYLTDSNKYRFQMLTNKDKENTNWVYHRQNGQIIKGRDYYYKSVKVSFILRNDKKIPPLSICELEEINLIRQAKKQELNNLKHNLNKNQNTKKLGRSR